MTATIYLCRVILTELSPVGNVLALTEHKLKSNLAQ